MTSTSTSELPVWFIPDRRKGDRQLKTIPAEIYPLIFDNIVRPPCQTEEIPLRRYRHTLASLSLVCSFFRAICQPRLFSRLTFNVHGRASSTRRKTRNKWCASLDARDVRAIALGNSVEAISYQEYNSPYEANSWFYTDLLRRNIGATRHLRSLTYIHLYHCNVNFVVLSTLASVSTLRTLDLECCKSHHDANGFVGTLSTTAWTSLRVVNGTSHLYGLSNVLAYMIDRSNLRFLAIDAASEKLVKDLFLAPGGYDSKLETLDVILSAGSSRERFISRLRQERCLTTLTIAAATDTRHWAAPLCFTFKMSLWRSGHKQPVGCTLTLENDWGPWGMADMQAILGAWSPAIPGDLAAHISFTYVPRRSEDVDVVVRDMPLAVVGAMLCLFARRKAHGNAKVTSILSTSDTLELDIHSADQALLDMVNERLELRRLLDNSLDDTFPSLDCIKVNGERRWRRQTGAGRWQRSTAV